MSTFLFKLGRWCARHPFKTMSTWFVVALAVFAASAQFGDELVDDYAVPGVESQEGTDVLEERFPEFAGASSRIVFHTADGRIDDNLLDRGYASLDDGVLAIGFDGLGEVDPSRTPHITITVEHLDTIENHGTGAVSVTGVDSASVEVFNGGDGSVVATGTADTVELRSTSRGAVDLAGLVATTVELADTDDGAIAINATDRVEGEISGDADVVVHGNPATTDVDLDGDGALVTA